MRAGAVGHLDADCFYVSAERVRDSFLVSKPIGVLGNQGACVIAKSYEMKTAGVKTGEPIWDALKKCPHGIYLKRDFRWYEVLSRSMLKIVRELSPQVEYYSIDEFFFQIPCATGTDLHAAAANLRDQLWQRIGVPVTVGIARTKTLAKLISDTAKPFGALALLQPQDVQSMLAQRPVTDISGIAGRRAARLAPYHIHTCLEFARADRRLIRQLLTITGEILWWEINGEAVMPLHAERPPHKMLSRGGSIGAACTDREVVFAWLIRNLERLIDELHFHQVVTDRLVVWIGYRDDSMAQGHASLLSPTDRFDLLLEAVCHAFQQAWHEGAAAQRMHLIATKLHWRGCVQKGLFEPPEDEAQAVALIKRAVNLRFGRFTLRSGATLFLDEVYRDRANHHDICDVHGKICF